MEMAQSGISSSGEGSRGAGEVDGYGCLRRWDVSGLERFWGGWEMAGMRMWYGCDEPAFGNLDKLHGEEFWKI